VKLALLAETLEGACLGGPGAGNVEVRGVTYDSRKVEPGDLFAALRGERRDGTDFVRQAAGRGAIAILTESAERLTDLPQLVVPDARAALADAARLIYGDPAERLRLVGVTGTNGKTTTTYMLRAALAAGGSPCGLIGTVEVDLGSGGAPATLTTPESADLYRAFRDMIANGCTHAAVEVSSHALAQDRTRGLTFAVAVFTNLTQDHLDYHGTMENYLDAKARLFETLAPDALAVLNADDPASETLARRTRGRVVSYGLGEDADIRAEIREMTAAGSRFSVHAGGSETEFRLGLAGRHNVQNVLACAAAATGLGLPIEAVAAGLAALAGVPGRLEPVDEGQGFRVLVDYAHTPDALAKVLAALRELRPARILTVFGCGGDRDRTKRPTMARAAGEASDRVFVTSDNPRSEEPDAIIDEILPGFSSLERVTVEPDRARAIRAAVEEAREDDVVLIAGKGHENYQIVGAERLSFDDRKVARAILRERVGGEAACCV